jgi:hypothetical protein
MGIVVCDRMSLIAQTGRPGADKVGLVSCIEVMRKRSGALQRQKKGVLREETYHVRCVSGPDLPSLGELGS